MTTKNCWKKRQTELHLNTVNDLEIPPHIVTKWSDHHKQVIIWEDCHCQCSISFFLLIRFRCFNVDHNKWAKHKQQNKEQTRDGILEWHF
jgi:hypothetical protein